MALRALLFLLISSSVGTISFPIFLKGIQPERYESLSHPGDSFSYDIFSQAAQAVLVFYEYQGDGKRLRLGRKWHRNPVTLGVIEAPR